MAQSFKTYEHAVAWVKKGRDPSVGRRSSALMLKLEDSGVITVSHSYRVWKGSSRSETMWHCTPIAEVRPGNVFTFTLDSSDMQRLSASICMSLYKVFGLMWERVGMGRYVVWSYDKDGGYFDIQRRASQTLRALQRHVVGV